MVHTGCGYQQIAGVKHIAVYQRAMKWKQHEVREREERDGWADTVSGLKAFGDSSSGVDCFRFRNMRDVTHTDRLRLQRIHALL